MVCVRCVITQWTCYYNTTRPAHCCSVRFRMKRHDVCSRRLALCVSLQQCTLLKGTRCTQSRMQLFDLRVTLAFPIPSFGCLSFSLVQFAMLPTDSLHVTDTKCLAREKRVVCQPKRRGRGLYDRTSCIVVAGGWCAFAQRFACW